MKHLLFIFLIFPASFSWATLKISIDPGHGGSDNGAVHESIKESKIVLSISKKLYKLLEKDKDFKPQLLRNKNKDLSLDRRVKLSKRFDADLFVSIHANAHSNKRARGAEFYIQNQLPVEEDNLFLAHHESHQHRKEKVTHKGDVQSILFDLKKSQKVLKSYQLSSYLRRNWPKKKRQMIRQGPFYVLSQSEIPAVLVEVGYLSNKKERSQLTSERFQKVVAQRIYDGLKDYLKNEATFIQPQ